MIVRFQTERDHDSSMLRNTMAEGLGEILSLAGNPISSTVKDPAALIVKGPLPKYTLSIDEILGDALREATSNQELLFLLCRPGEGGSEPIPVGLSEIRFTESGGYELVLAGHSVLEQPTEADRFGSLLSRVLNLSLPVDGASDPTLTVFHVFDARLWLVAPMQSRPSTLKLDELRLYLLDLALPSWHEDAIQLITLPALKERLQSVKEKMADNP